MKNAKEKVITGIAAKKQLKDKIEQINAAMIKVNGEIQQMGDVAARLNDLNNRRADLAAEKLIGGNTATAEKSLAPLLSAAISENETLQQKFDLLAGLDRKLTETNQEIGSAEASITSGLVTVWTDEAEKLAAEYLTAAQTASELHRRLTAIDYHLSKHGYPISVRAGGFAGILFPAYQLSSHAARLQGGNASYLDFGEEHRANFQNDIDTEVTRLKNVGIVLD